MATPRSSHNSLRLESEDLDLAKKTLALIPDLLEVALIGKIARQSKLKYPVRSHEQLIALFKAAPHLTLGDRHKVDPSQVKMYVPREYFPIENEEQLLSRVYITFGIQEEHGRAIQRLRSMEAKFKMNKVKKRRGVNPRKEYVRLCLQPTMPP